MPDDRIVSALKEGRRVLLAGAAGTGKSTLAAMLAARLERDGARCLCVGCDPGSPAFGPPGAIAVAEWRDGRFVPRDLEPLCSLDAARFRLPLVQAVARVLARAELSSYRVSGTVVDGPGLVRGVAAAELLEALVTAAAIDVVVKLERGAPSHGELDDELAALGVTVCRVPADERARAPSKRARAVERTKRWEEHLERAEECAVDLDALAVVGTPPPSEAPAAWAGRQIALLDAAGAIAFGEIDALDGTVLRARMRGSSRGATALLVRDVQRDADGLLRTVKPVIGPAARACGTPTVAVSSEPPQARPLAAKVGPFVATLLNGVFGDPLLLVRVQHAKRCLLFDLGEAGRLPARSAHQVTDIFFTHAHADHVGGFLSFLRARIGAFPPCRVFGPEGIAENVAGLVAGIHWDRAGEGRPRFTIGELRGDERLLRFSVSAGERDPTELGETRAADGVLLEDPLLRVRAVLLDHRTPVLAFALEAPREINVRKERLEAFGVAPGPWLTELKERAAAADYSAEVSLPGGAARGVRQLADELLLIGGGRKLVYATDLADTAENRERLARLGRDAHTLFLEATFCVADRARAERTGHLTTSACAEIAAAARVERLVPFHFSKRYESERDAVYRELAAASARATSTAQIVRA